MKTWILQNETTTFETKRMRGAKVTYVAGDGDSVNHTIIRSEPSIAVIVRREDGKICFIKQMRTTTGKYHMEIPAGCKEVNESNILETAKREVREETGFLTKDVKILVKGPSLLDPSKSDEDYGVAIATPATQKSRCLDVDEKIEKEVIWIDENEVFERLHHQMANNEPFYEGLYMSGHTMYALLAYKFLKG